MGRANRLLGARVSAIATSFPGALEHDARLSRQGHARPAIRCAPAVIAAARTPYAAPDAGEPFHLLVFGGSQGARFMSDIVPAAIGAPARRSCARGCRSSSRRGRRISRASRAAYAQARRRGRGGAFLRRPAGADRGRPSGHVALRRLDGGRARGDRPAGDPGAAAACARSTISWPMPPCWRMPAGRSACARPISRRSAWPAKSRRSPPPPRGSPRWPTAARSVSAPDAAERLADLVLKVANVSRQRTTGLFAV